MVIIENYDIVHSTLSLPGHNSIREHVSPLPPGIVSMLRIYLPFIIILFSFITSSRLVLTVIGSTLSMIQEQPPYSVVWIYDIYLFTN